jgi:phosphoribosyl 1,2-cyclic phosphodiesterase
MVTVSVLGSGSRGNATFIRTEQVRLLIDAGMSRKETARRLEMIGEDPDGIDAVFITHEHNDHAAGLKTLMKELPVEAYLTCGALHALATDQYELSGSKFVRIVPGTAVSIGDAEVFPFRVPHDAAEPVAFSVTCGGIKITQLTDVGYMPEFVTEQLRGSHVLILESNHDLEMLRIGPYPWSLKQRLMGRYGHLSNAAVAKFIREQYDGVAEVLLLAHLSVKNNHPQLAQQEAAHALRDRGFCTDSVRLTHQDQPTEPIRL